MSTTANYSIYAIPLYYLITLYPHIYAVGLIKKATNNAKWDNTNPRSTKWSTKLASSVPAAVYAKFERGEAAHKNGMENAPLFIAAVLAGNMAGMDVAGLNAFAGLYVLSRLAYTLLYVNTESLSRSYARSLVWVAGTAGCLVQLVRAGNKMY